MHEQLQPPQGISAPIPQYGDENIDLSILWQHLCTEAQVTLRGSQYINDGGTQYTDFGEIPN